MSDQLPHDDELRSLYRRLPAEEPRAEIDEAILSAARELADAEARKVAEAAAREVAEAEARGRHNAQRRRFLARARWMLPLAAAASVILTVTLTRLTPEQPAVAPSDLRESSDSAVAYGTAMPEAREEGEAERTAEALEDAPEKRTRLERRFEPAQRAAEAPAAARKSALEKPVAVQSAPTAKSAPEAPPAAAKQKAETAARETEQLEARRLAEGKKIPTDSPSVRSSSREKPDMHALKTERAPAARESAPAAATPEYYVDTPAAPPPAASPRAGAGAAAPVEPSRDTAPTDQLKSLGYLDGGAPPAPQAKPAPPDGAAAASPPVGAVASRDDDEADKAAGDDAAAGKDARAEQSQARQRPATAAHEWPFLLAPGLDAAEACRRTESALRTPCRYEGGMAVVEPKKAVVVDRGEFAGRKVTRVRLVAQGGILAKVALQVEGFTTEQVLVAPPAR